MNFRVDPLTVVTTLHSMIEQNNGRMTVIKAVHRLAAKGLALPGKTDKEQAQVLNSLISLCSPGIFDIRPGKNGGIGLPSMHSLASRGSLAGLVSQAASDAEGQEELSEFKTGT